MKKILSIILAMTMLLSVSGVFVFADAPAVDLPTATTSELDVSEIEGVDLTFAMNFLADEATAEQLEAYGDWYADFVLTVNKNVTFNAEGTADGYLAGQYDTYSSDWLKVPAEDVEVSADESLRIMAIAAELMDNASLKITCNDVYTFVHDFDCGVYFDSEFLAANPDLEATLELRIYNPENEEENYVIGETYDFSVSLPTATTSVIDVTEIDGIELTYAMNFLADEASAIQLATYGDWYADFVLTVDKDVTFNAEGTADGYLAGQYDTYSSDWLKVPAEDVEVTAGESLRIMATAAELMDNAALKITCNDVYTFVHEFNCGVYFSDEFLANNDLKATLELRIYNPEDEEESYVIGEAYTFVNVNTDDSVKLKGYVKEEEVVFTEIEFTEDETVYIDASVFTEEEKEITSVTLPTEVLETVGNEDMSVEIKLSEDVIVVMNEEAVKAITSEADTSSTLTLLVKKADDEILEEEQIESIDELKNAVVYKMTIVTEDGTEVYTSDDLDDEREIVVNIYYPVSGSNEVVVNHLKDDGTLEDVDYTYENDIVTIILPHFSEYVIHQERPVSTSTVKGGGSTRQYTVRFNTDGGSAIANQKVDKDDKVTEPKAPTKDGYTFEGWYTSSTFAKEYDFETAVTKDITIYAKWTKNPGTDEEETTTDDWFVDVATTAWYYDSIKYAKDNGLMNGDTATTFAPNGLLTRAMLVTILYRNEGEPAVNRSIPFADIDLGAYYANAVIWAQQNGIVNGISETEFAPNANITREQIAAIICRYAQFKGYDVSVGENTNILSYDDADSVSKYAVAPMQYVVGSGLIKGKSATTLNPKDNATRAEIATILQRFIEANK